MGRGKTSSGEFWVREATRSYVVGVGGVAADAAAMAGLRSLSPALLDTQDVPRRMDRGAWMNSLMETPTASTEATLYIVATPIGNLEDITLRALRILGSVEMLAAEDTRHTRKLLTHHGISRPLMSYHDHNKIQQAARILALLQEGQSVALVTDAGTPGIADPAYYLLQVLLPHAIPIVPIPGPTAAIAALSVAGLPTDRFVFEGFLPVKSGRRRQRLEALRDEPRTIVLYESPHRLLKLLQELVDHLGEERRLVIARELTKRFEEVLRGTTATLLQTFQERSIRGEFTLIIAGCPL